MARLFRQFLRQEFGIKIPSNHNPLGDIYWLVAAAQPGPFVGRSLMTTSLMVLQW
jgi:hypothetical protein